LGNGTPGESIVGGNSWGGGGQKRGHITEVGAFGRDGKKGLTTQKTMKKRMTRKGKVGGGEKQKP